MTPAAAEPGVHQLEQGVVADLGIAAGHGHLVVVEEQHVLGHLVGGDPLPQEGPDVVGRGRLAVAQHDARDHRLVEAGVGHAEHPGQLHRGAGPQRDLHLGGRDVGPARLDHLGASPGPVDVAVGAHVAGVAGVEEPVLVEALVRRAAQVAEHAGGAGHAQLTLLVDAQQLPRVGVDHPQPRAGQQGTVTDLGPLPRRVGGVGAHEGARLGHAPAHRHDPPGIALDAGMAGVRTLP